MRLAASLEAMEHAFGSIGAELYSVAFHLCQSLLEHVQSGKHFRSWEAPFSDASIGKQGNVEARDMASLLSTGLSQNSMLHTLMASYKMPVSDSADSLPAKVKTFIRNNRNTEHLAKRFSRPLSLGTEAMPMSVEFLGANYVAYFLQLPKNKHAAQNIARQARGKLFELQSVRNHFTKKPVFTPFDDERPEKFELLVVGDKKDVLQSQVWRQIEMLGDASELQTRLLTNPAAAANEVAARERATA